MSAVGIERRPAGKEAHHSEQIRALRLSRGGEDSLYHLPPSKVRPDQTQPRKHFDKTELESLAASIKEVGVINPIEVRKSGNNFILLTGERRLRGARLANLKTIPAMVRVEDDEAKRRLRQIVENVQRSDLNVVELAAGYQALIDGGLKQKDIAAKLGKMKSHVSKVITIGEFVGKLDGDLRDKVCRENLSVRFLYSIATAKPVEKAIEKLSQVLGGSGQGKRPSSSGGRNDPLETPTKGQLTRAFKGMEAKEISALLVERLPATLLSKIYHHLR